ncbi:MULTISPECIES: sigma-70 family RNA polymerase sigma factor [unclassified Nocardioides]|uniref:sigma-70 family RNA polymerase sigma factor n=1 Tax=unclassified Nocardioides TaxID=2615069 RepID=UPI0006F5AE71|nr:MULTISPECIES: sigma-70 family RNA polymerase sigma factor [unclassified Nocardioides]KQY57763.1 RNA polymerase subunit sigma-70 [Nocardioides sp. Root140]KQZ68996.1 RNA polymerase subunit sigma-70 [Nocardioides sp. Root151]KRF20502.1 RNA polymerase subunit sigma-70 [Nocardioides sp. Soil796]
MGTPSRDSTPRAPTQSAGQVWAEASACFRAWTDGETGELGLSGLVRVMTPVLWHVVRSYRLPHELAEDVVQTTWLALVRRRDAIEDPVAIGGWLTTTARREAWRVSKLKNQAIPVEDEEIAFRLPRQRSAESHAVEADESSQLWRVVDELPDRCRRLLRIVAFENRPDYTHVAQTLDMPVGSIGPTRSRCLAKLRIALMQIDDPEAGR